MLTASSDALRTKLRSELEATAVEAAWAQWASLGAGASPLEEPCLAMVDPEALVLLSLAMQDAERRLVDFLTWWAGVGAPLLSVQRIKTMKAQFPAPVVRRLGGFAQQAVQAGDKRWRRYASGEPLSPTGRGRKGAARPRLIGPPTLLLRLRAGFGVSAKADVAAFLIGLQGRQANVHEIADATGYTNAAVRSAAQDMTLAHIVEETADYPVCYFTHVTPWAGLLGFEVPGTPSGEQPVAPAWRYWASLFAFLAQAHHLLSDTASGTQRDYLLSTRARDLFARHQGAFARNRILTPTPEAYRGAAYVEGFLDTVLVLRKWISQHL